MKTFIITGSREEGKTMFLKDLYDFLILFKIDVKGFISKAIPSETGSRDFKIIDLEDHSELHLSSRNPRIDYKPAGKFHFNPVAVKKGENIIYKALKSQTKVLIIDEIGPVELSGKIWYKVFQKVREKYDGILVISVRDRILTEVIEKFGIHEAFIEDVNITNPRKTGESILSILK